MAEQKMSMMAMSWGRQPDGRFFLQLAVPVNGPAGQQIQVPVVAFLLTREEEQSLKASLLGLHVATNLAAPGNGHSVTQ